MNELARAWDRHRGAFKGVFVCSGAGDDGRIIGTSRSAKLASPYADLFRWFHFETDLRNTEIVIDDPTAELGLKSAKRITASFGLHFTLEPVKSQELAHGLVVDMHFEPVESEADD